MTTQSPRRERRTAALSRDQIVATAVEILDADGEDALTFRAISARLATGAGALYGHVANKGALLTAITDAVIGRVLAAVDPEADAAATVRAVGRALFDAVDAHPWVGAHLSREPWQVATVRIFEAFGAQLDALGVPDRAQFDCASALLNFVLGLAGQYAAGARLLAADTDREEFLTGVAARWAALDPEEFPFVRRVAGQLAAHDDREQFLAGLDVVVAGIVAAR